MTRGHLSNHDEDSMYRTIGLSAVFLSIVALPSVAQDPDSLPSRRDRDRDEDREWRIEPRWRGRVRIREPRDFAFRRPIVVPRIRVEPRIRVRPFEHDFGERFAPRIRVPRVRIDIDRDMLRDRARQFRDQGRAHREWARSWSRDWARGWRDWGRSWDRDWARDWREERPRVRLRWRDSDI